MTLTSYLMTEEGAPECARKCVPDRPVSRHYLNAIGVGYYTITNVTNWMEDPTLTQLRAARGYEVHEENILSKTATSEEQAAKFFTEHLHDEEEIRCLLEGSGYFDIRGLDNEWIRMHVQQGDLIILPSGSYHRFCMDEQYLMKTVRFYQNDKKSAVYVRPSPDVEINTEERPSRVAYWSFVRATLLGPISSRIHKVWDVDHFDAILDGLRGKLTQKDSKLYVFFTASMDALLNRTWCGDCNDVPLKERWQSFVTERMSLDAESQFVQVIIERSSYCTKEYVLRHHPLIKLSNVPTLLSLTKELQLGDLCHI